MPGPARKAAAAAIARTLGERFAPETLNALGAYWPFRREFDPLPFLRRVLEAGGQVALPAVVAPRTPLEFRPWTPQARMEPGVWNIPQPVDGPAVAPAAFLIPLVGFDAAGYRLGYGAGYYDRTLAARQDRPLAIGVGFELSRLPTIRPQPHDVPMDYILTEAGLAASPAASARRAR